MLLARVAVAGAMAAAVIGGPRPAAAQPGAGPPAGPEVTWDFETGDLRGWRASGLAFSAEPTREDRSAAGLGHQGEYWVSSFRQLRSSAAAFERGPAGDAAQGALESQPFEIPRGRLSFLIGGGGSFATRLELVVIDENGRETRVLHATGDGSDAMQRVAWDVTRFAGRRGRIRIVDASTGAGGRISVDDIRFASIVVPNLIGRDEAEARRVLGSRGLRLGAAARVESRVAEGRVLAQTPRAGSRVEPGTAVNLDVAEPAQVATPNLVGTNTHNLIDIRYTNIGELIEANRSPYGKWVEYYWPNPATETDERERKLTWIKYSAGYTVAVGIYPDAPGAHKDAPISEYDKDRQEVVWDMVNDAIESFNIDMAGTMAEIQDPENDRYHDNDIYLSVLDKNGVIIAHGDSPDAVGVDTHDLVDIHGTNLGELFVSNYSPYGKWVEYYWPNAATESDEAEFKMALLVTVGEYVIGGGIHPHAMEDP